VKLIAPGWLDFDRNGKITGSAGCNKFTGSYTRDGWNLTLKVETSTRMPCPSGLSAQEAAIFASFDAVTSFKNGSTNLNLLNASGKEALTYKASDTPLVGTKWQATALNTGAGSVTALPSKPLVTATFDASGAIGGIGGCNSYGGSYTTGPGTKMTILKLTSTMMACMNGVDEAGYFGALEKTTNYVLSHGTLTLKDDTGATLVQYVPVAR
jgi:heat shock protein HslJ